MTVLSINLNKVALLRNQRDIDYPSVTGMAKIALAAGAGGITVHPRPDQRHTRKSDVYELSKMLREEYGAPIEFNIEGNPTEEFMQLVADTKPEQVTLVPDDPDQNTSDHGWDIRTNKDRLKEIVDRLHAQNARVSVFIDHDPDVALAAAEIGADRVELYTGPYYECFFRDDREQVLSLYKSTAIAARDSGLGVNAGHDLNLDNLAHFLQAIPWTDEVSIGHALTADALIYGMDGAIKAYLAEIAKK
ncbi:pyridoxamine 5'-phosphate oxidase [Kiloniella litopenaei]|uniref:Pyridoxine 5'-phosphate synthase n=1 Tax=Kiloniella litopenaei TaxID=1549748 RepID=A0A0M2R4V8_9PROT|nr:pyridoxine 5'-phosphate synthase [Kiloniella litopenaei]KKJ76887.1 pyridoxamine 5'-phosphate oxidase [Kiloniella litopenaei]